MIGYKVTRHKMKIVKKMQRIRIIRDEMIRHKIEIIIEMHRIINEMHDDKNPF